MEIREILKEKGKDVMSIGSDVSIADLAAKMKERKIGALMVEDSGILKGIVTERDIVIIIANTGGDLRGLQVSDIMVKSENLIVAEPDDLSDHVMAMMIQKGIRHMPIVENGAIAGVVSIRDVVKAHVKTLQTQARFLSEFIE
ncbi:MAG: CBS domain-containing protein [Nitrospirae bacterium]|nr:CBS domain-containing protein [Nitrospirota bacterium]